MSWVRFVKGKDGCYRCNLTLDLNHDYLRSPAQIPCKWQYINIIKMLEENFSSVKIVDDPIEDNYSTYAKRFSFDDPADEAYFLILSSDGFRV